ncbi:MAG TPA: hypothetical protein VM691_08480 [Myxococcales bacterium]|nr:hypothetical protein [Myxococcales bacterium]
MAADIYRPAAVEQLKQLGAKLDIPVFHEENTKPPEMAKHALAFAGQKNRDVIIYDTAGRDHDGRPAGLGKDDYRREAR